MANLTMRLKYNPYPIIFSQGDARTQLTCLDFFGMGESPRSRRCLQAMVEQQRPDGSFPSSLDSSHWGMQETIRDTLLLLKLATPPDGENVQSAVRFILEHQRPEGSWCENPELLIPSEQTWLSNDRGVTWLTADVIDLLHQIEMENQPECQLAVTWLKSVQNPDGGWPSVARENDGQRVISSDPDSTAQISFLMGKLFGDDDPAYLRGVALFESFLDECACDAARGYWVRALDGRKNQIEVYHLTHLFLSWLLDPLLRFQYGYDVDDARVKSIMEALIKLQNADGGWTPFWSDVSSPGYTVIALKVLVLSRKLVRESMAEDVQQYTS